MRAYAKLSAASLLALARGAGFASLVSTEIVEELARRRSKAAKHALAEIRQHAGRANSVQPELTVVEKFADADEACAALRRLWNVGDGVEYLEIRYETAHFGWSIGFTSGFRKAVAGADRKTQGRVMTALSDLVDAPTKPRGDTVKPLSNAFKGLWRYRIGDYRLIYQPQVDAMLVLLVDFVPRGDAYGDG